MNLFGQKMNLDTLNNRQLNQRTIRAAAQAERNAELPKGTAKLLSLLAGDVFQGEVTNVVNKDVTIRLPNQQEIKAILGEAVNLNIGEFLSFEVRENTGERLLIRPFGNADANVVQNPVLAKALHAAGLLQTHRNSSIVEAHMEAGLPIDRNSLMNTIRLLGQNPDIEVHTVVQMLKYQLPITAENLKQMQHYERAEHRVIRDLDAIGQQVTGCLQEMSRSGSFTQVLNFYQEIEAALSLGNVGLADSSSGAADSYQLDSHPVDSSLIDFHQADSGPLEQNLSDRLSRLGNELRAGMTSKENLGLTEHTENMQEVLVRSEGNPDRSVSIEAEPLYQRNLLSEGSLTGQEFWRGLHQLLAKPEQLKESAVRDLFSSQEFQQLLKNHMANQWLIRPEDLMRDHALEEKYERIYEQIQKLQDMAQKGGTMTEILSNSAANAKDNMDFMHALNQVYTYVQLPLQLKEQHVHGELYVYTNKKNLARKGNEISVLLHLDMEALGPVDVHVTLMKQTVNAQFYVEDKETADWVEENLIRLEEPLAAKGFVLTGRASVREKPLDFVEDFLGNEVQKSSVKRYNFDVRM